VFESYFEWSVDAILLLDPQAGVFVDCNRAAVELAGAENKQQLLLMRPEELSPPFQPDGAPSAQKTVEIDCHHRTEEDASLRRVMRRRDGRDIPIEVSATAVVMGGKSIQVIISRTSANGKKPNANFWNEPIPRTACGRTHGCPHHQRSRFRALVEHAPEAIVVFNGDTGRFLFGNEHACRLYGVPMERLTELTPADVSPEFQPGGRRSSEFARELMEQALSGEKPVFEWMHQQPNGRLIPTEVRLLRLPAEGQNLIRASILDNTERKRAERALARI
jgi:PAS domain S-box-containing protein